MSSRQRMPACPASRFYETLYCVCSFLYSKRMR
ncbi:hypothetical protein CBM2587_B80038 [Cupriavidus taiwanensis]|uniref:Uncharacterized protein n=1 Tax=Cupriavidus taiwanensis TaxID=164546 RepID=A0A975XD61_9BURK|nr:hypothetical protein CBM2587_B80038 [Cupriavidus taiwanensis]